jgi:hypothetical protein
MFNPPKFNLLWFLKFYSTGHCIGKYLSVQLDDNGEKVGMKD